MECWGDAADLPHVIHDAPTDPGFTQVSVGYDFACALPPDGLAVCWGDMPGRVLTPPPGVQFASIWSDYYVTCGITLDGELACWGGGDEDGWTDAIVDNCPGGGGWSQVSVGGYEACALSTDGLISCWGQDWYGIDEIPDLPAE